MCPPLLAWLSSRLTEQDLVRIASLDYMTAVPEHLAALRRIASGDLSVLAPIDWHPHEVLQLARWDEGGVWTEERHLRRLFACTALLVTAAEPENRGKTTSINESTVVAVESLLAACPDRAHELVPVLDRLRERWTGADELPHLVLARFLLREAAGATADELVDLLALADQMAEEVRSSDDWPWRPPKKAYGWILDLTHFTQRARSWRQLLDAALERRRAAPETVVVAERLSALRDRKE